MSRDYTQVFGQDINGYKTHELFDDDGSSMMAIVIKEGIPPDKLEVIKELLGLWSEHVELLLEDPPPEAERIM
jgi:hypothetical protein